MKTLGPGVRVYIKWCPPYTLGDGCENVVCNTGTVKYAVAPYLAAIYFKGAAWFVEVDGLGEYVIAQRLLSPIDDDPPKVAEETREREVTA